MGIREEAIGYPVEDRPEFVCGFCFACLSRQPAREASESLRMNEVTLNFVSIPVEAIKAGAAMVRRG